MGIGPLENYNAALKYGATVNTTDDLALENGKVLIGDTNGVAAAQTLSGDVTVNNSGVTAIGALKVTTAMIAANNVTLAKLASGITPSHVVKFAGTSPAYGGGGTSTAITVTGALATDVATAVIRASTNAVSIVKAVLTNDTLTVHFSADPGAATTVDYSVLRAAA